MLGRMEGDVWVFRDGLEARYDVNHGKMKRVTDKLFGAKIECLSRSVARGRGA